MLAFVVRRFLISIPVIVLSSLIVFLLVANSGDPLAELKAKPNVPASTIRAREKELNLDKPVFERYGIWASGFVQGDMGRSQSGEEVRGLLGRRIGVTMRLVLLATFLGLAAAVVLGTLAAVKQYSWFDHGTTFASFVFFSMPVFWLAALLKEYVGIGINRATGKQILYTVGERTPNLTGSFATQLADRAGHLVLPTIALMAVSVASWSRFLRSSMLEAKDADYVRMARAKGLSGFRVTVRHGLRNALIPLTTIAALDFGAVLGGAVITESVFSWQGMGRMLLDGLNTRDVNVVLAWLMVGAVLVVLFNLIADILYAVLDPRIRLA